MLRRLYRPVGLSPLLALAACGVARAASPYFVLDPTAYKPLLQEDYAWVVASPGAPLFESSDPNMTFAWYHRWRLYKNHTHTVNETAPTGEHYAWVVTEFAPDVPWAGLDNAIPCAAGHHIQDGRWLHDPSIMDNYTTWWSSGIPGVLLNYYFWHAQALLARLEVVGAASNLGVVGRILPRVADLVAAYANGTLPSHGGGSKLLGSPANCVYNVPGNEGEARRRALGGAPATAPPFTVRDLVQENSISGPGCRPLVQVQLSGHTSWPRFWLYPSSSSCLPSPIE